MTIDRDPLDPALDALLRAHSSEMPSAALDTTILAAAHRAVAGGPRTAEVSTEARPWRQWVPLAAAATIAAVAFGVLQVAPTDTRVASPVVSDMPAIAPVLPDSPGTRGAAAVNGESSPKKTMQPAAPPVSASGSSARRETAMPAAPPVSASGSSAKRETAMPPPSAKRETATPAEEPASGAQRERGSAPQPFPLQKAQAEHALAPPAPAPAAEPAAPQRESARASTGSLRADQAAGIESRSVAEWIARIRALRDAGKLAEAAQALEQFRLTSTDADARLPEDLRAWAGTIRR